MVKTALVLFCGTKSIDRALEAAGFYVQSLDIDPKCQPTWCCDIMQWEAWRGIEPGTLDYIHASPPCTQYSLARTTAKTARDLEGADKVVQRTLEIIRYLRPKVWTLENPQTGLLKTRPIMQGIPYKDLTYCMYSDGINHRYKKPTRIWGYLPTFVPRPFCSKSNPCTLVVEGKHPECAQRFSRAGQSHYQHTLGQLYSIPVALCDEIATAAARYVDSLEEH